jgi:hypothetical protein
MDIQRIVPQAQQVTELGKADQPNLIAKIALTEGSLYGVESPGTRP